MMFIRKQNAPPADTVQSYQSRIKVHIYLWSVLFLTPFFFIQLFAHNYLLAFLIVLTCSYLVISAVQHLNNKSLGDDDLGFPVLGYLTTIIAVIWLGESALLWAYPAMIATFFLIQPKKALILTTCFVIALCIVGALNFSWQLFARMLASLTLSTAFAYIIAWLVGKQNASLIEIATTDPLTQCHNRAQMNRDLQEAIDLKARYGQVASLLVVDIDHFKTVNDTLGHKSGDIVLVELANVLQRRIRNTDMLYRFGGEEFVILLRNTNHQDAGVLAEDIRKTVEGFAFSGIRQLTISIGGTELQPDDTLQSWFVRGDDLLYQAKLKGRNEVVMS